MLDSIPVYNDRFPTDLTVNALGRSNRGHWYQPIDGDYSPVGRETPGLLAVGAKRAVLTLDQLSNVVMLLSMAGFILLIIIELPRIIRGAEGNE